MRALNEDSQELGISRRQQKECCLYASDHIPWSFLPAGTGQGYGDKERINAVKRSAVSTGKLSALLHLHIRPIDPVVFREPSYVKYGKRHLAEGFTLICLQ